MNHFLRIVLLTAIMCPTAILLSGCGEAEHNAAPFRGARDAASRSNAQSVAPAKTTAGSDASEFAEGDGAVAFSKNDSTVTMALAAQNNEPPKGAAGEAKLPSPRKIIYNATVNLVVEDFDKVRSQVKDLVEKFNGYVASSNFDGTAGSSRSGVWTLRIPVGDYSGFVEAISNLGTIENQNTSSKEVTEEFYDVDARIRNKQKEEERLLSHLKEHTGKLDEILQVEREISRVREEIERLQGRMRVLTNLTDLTTVTLRIQERRTTLVAVAEAPTFRTRISETFGDSMNALISAGQALVLLFVAVGPWMAVLAIPTLIVFAVVRRRTKRVPAQA